MASGVFHPNGPSVDNEINLLGNNAGMTSKTRRAAPFEIHHDKRCIRAACRSTMKIGCAGYQP